MEYFAITKRPEGFHIEGFPDSVKVIRIKGPEARKLADLALHKADLNFALECLDQINGMPEIGHVLRQALWRSAVVHFMKCFGDSKSRVRLVPRNVYKGDPEAMEVFRYFKSMRDKHLIHDENSYTQCLRGAVINKKDMDHKIAKIVCLSVIGDTLGQANYSNLHLLISRAREWIVPRFDTICNALSAELESNSYEALVAQQGITYSPPGPEEIHHRRYVH